MSTVRLSDEQDAALRTLLSFPKRVQTLGGFAGTGKTTLVGRLVADRRLGGWAVCAYTGKAAHVLRTKGVASASTIHSLIYRPVEQPDGSVEFDLRDDAGCAGFVVDEASMVSRQIHDDLMSFGLPIVYVGDHGQLEPVGADDFNLMARPDVTLETVHRNAGEIARFAEHLRKGEPAETWAPAGEGPGRVTVLSRPEWEDSQEDLPDQMICAFNATRVAMNAAAREWLGREGDAPAAGDRIICLRNERELGLFNGMQGDILRIDPDRETLTFRSDALTVKVGYVPEQFGAETTLRERTVGRVPFDWAYCVTAHKSQGSEWDRVTVFEQVCKRWDHRRWAYTAASRAKRELIWVKA